LAQIGTCWNQASWSTSAWAANTWAGQGVAPPPVVVQTGGSGPFRKRHFVEIEGELFEVRNQREVEELLQAVEEATKSQPVRKPVVKVTRKSAKAPEFVEEMPQPQEAAQATYVAPDNREQVQEIIRQWVAAQVAAELDDEEAIFVLMH